MSLDVYLTENKCEKCGRGEEVYTSNITHNLNTMAEAAGIYNAVWRPDENGFTKAKELIAPLRAAINDMESHPEKYKKYDPPNGWGSFGGLLSFLEKYLQACEKYPEASVSVWR